MFQEKNYHSAHINKPYTILHISDLHCTKVFLKFPDLITKRLTGYLNNKFFRRNYFLQNIQKIIYSLSKKKYNLVCITGDITNLAYEEEFYEAKKIITPLLESNPCLLIAGNHDRYTHESTNRDLFYHYFQDYTPFQWGITPKIYSFFLTPVLEITLFDMSCPRMCFNSRGQISLDTSNNPEDSNKENSSIKKEPLIKIAAGHYPIISAPNKRIKFLHDLKGKKQLKKFLLQKKFRAYFHGHLHQSYVIEEKKTNMYHINSGGSFLTHRVHSGCHECTIYPTGEIYFNKLSLSEMIL